MQNATTNDAAWIARPDIDRRIWPVLLGLVIVADIMLWSASWGLGLVVWILLTSGALHLFLRDKAQYAASAWAVLVFSLLPAIEVVQPLSVLIAIFGGCAFTAILTGAAPAQLWQAMSQVPFAGLTQTFGDVQAIVRMRPQVKREGLWHLAKDWVVPVALGAVFLVLIMAANPILQNAFSDLFDFDLFQYANPARFVFWCFAALFVWPALRLGRFASRLLRPAQRVRRERGHPLINTRSVTRALVLFNAMFAVQTLLDVAILTHGVSLPEGMSYAAYAHRGAYPLLATALLAGGFAIIAQPVIGAAASIRNLLLIWVAQTVLLVVSSLLRLDLYVDAYGLTYLRLAAFVWMIMMGAGLGLMIWQIAMRLPVGWMIKRSGLLAIAAIYLCAMTNFADIIARTNLAATERPVDSYYICNFLGEGAVPAILAYTQAQDAIFCHSGIVAVSQPSDWREWGYRNARLRSSVLQMQEMGQ